MARLNNFVKEYIVQNKGIKSPLQISKDLTKYTKSSVSVKDVEKYISEYEQSTVVIQCAAPDNSDTPAPNNTNTVAPNVPIPDNSAYVKNMMIHKRTMPESGKEVSFAVMTKAAGEVSDFIKEKRDAKSSLNPKFRMDKQPKPNK